MVRRIVFDADEVAARTVAERRSRLGCRYRGVSAPAIPRIHVEPADPDLPFAAVRFGDELASLAFTAGGEPRRSGGGQKRPEPMTAGVLFAFAGRDIVVHQQSDAAECECRQRSDDTREFRGECHNESRA
jgi:hypothetical protein